uniref:Uncharacterized protein n=1 Tax=Neolamprologus brichardi TaxID=32507 RepID=A0A3Q4GJ19_NEOBR
MQTFRTILISSFLVGYDPINKSNTFECKIQSLFVKLKGKAEVLWNEYYGKTVITYHSKDKYFTIKQISGHGCKHSKNSLPPR